MGYRDYLCGMCGTADESLFYNGKKNYCRKCTSIVNNNRNKGISEEICYEDVWNYFKPGAKQRITDYIYNEVIPELNKKLNKRK